MGEARTQSPWASRSGWVWECERESAPVDLCRSAAPRPRTTPHCACSAASGDFTQTSNRGKEQERQTQLLEVSDMSSDVYLQYIVYNLARQVSSGCMIV